MSLAFFHADKVIFIFFATQNFFPDIFQQQVQPDASRAGSFLRHPRNTPIETRLAITRPLRFIYIILMFAGI
jgi:hypothetical protein